MPLQNERFAAAPFFAAPIAPSGRELAPKASEGASGRCSFSLMKGRYLLVVFDTPPGFYRAISWNRYKKYDRLREVPSPAVKWALHPLAPSVLGLRPKPPPSRREVLWRAATVNACTVPMFSLPILLGNVTGHWRGSNDSLKATVRNWLRALPAGDSPPIPG